MLQELTITKFGVYETDKNKKPLVTKSGEKYKKVGIKVDYADYDGKWLSHLAFGPEDKTLNLKEGDRVTLKITQNGEYLNFDLPNRTDHLEARVERLERALSIIATGTKAAPSEAKETEEDIPF